MAKKAITSGSKSKASPAGPAKRVSKATKPKLKPGKFKPWTPAEVVEVFTRFRNANPEPKGELEHLNPYTLLVAVALSAQATDVGVNKATRHLFPVADTPEKMVELGEERLRDYIKTIGLYRTKAKNVIALSEQLIALHGSQVPGDRAALEALSASDARPRTSCSTSRLGSRPSPSTPICFASAIARDWRPAKHRSKLSLDC